MSGSPQRPYPHPFCSLCPQSRAWSIHNCRLQTPVALGTRKLGFGDLPSTAKFWHLNEVCGLLCDSAPPSMEGEGRELPSF